ncbi:MAG: Diguanylate cyclase with PAS/PAC sensor [Parcubacteria group bacterium GW2011_GWF2_38_76]|nr:MAG: Diguanylate cyclase with PAS/PAC sensor [Parcubacteria group bacterium GW2011_GWF2_38_76]
MIEKTIENAEINKRTLEDRDRIEKDATQKISEYLEAIPEQEMREEENAIINELKEHGFKTEEISKFVRRDVTRIKLAYQDNRTCFDEALSNRKYIETKLFKEIKSGIETENPEEKLKRVAVVNFDLNGLKSINDLMGHGKGDLALKTFAKIIQNGETVKWLEEEKKVEVTPFAQGGDEFGVYLNGEANLNELRDEIEKRFFEEASKADTSEMFDFSDPKVKEFFKDRGIFLNREGEVEVPNDFKFRFGTSVGLATAEEIYKEIKIGEKENINEKIRELRGQIIGLADSRAGANKTETKEKLKISGKSGNKFDEAQHALVEPRAGMEEILEELKEEKGKINCLKTNLAKSGKTEGEIKELEVC